MNTVRARLWRFIVQTNPDGTSDIVATEVGQGPLPVALSRLVHINALACDVRKIIDPRVRDQEVALLTSYLAGSIPGGPLTVDFPALLASSGHIGRFVAECAGLGVMTAASEALFMWKSGDGLHSFDVLPGHLVKRYGGGGVRPDLLFQMCCGPLAGEARGRRVRTKALFPAKETPQQRRRLLQLADWSAKHTDHAYFMSWVWIGPAGVSVDIFLPAGNDQVESDLMLGWIDEPGHAVWEIRAERRRDVRREAPAGPLIADDSEPLLKSLTIGYDDPPLNERVQSAEERLDAALSRRFETRADVEGSIADVAVRGRWVPAGGLGPATHEVLLGVLASRLPEHVTRRDRGERAEQNLDAYLDGRLLTVVRRIDEGRPSWEQITEGLLEVP